jgi:hypothetical protein
VHPTTPGHLQGDPELLLLMMLGSGAHHAELKPVVPLKKAPTPGSILILGGAHPLRCCCSRLLGDGTCFVTLAAAAHHTANTAEMRRIQYLRVEHGHRHG